MKTDDLLYCRLVRWYDRFKDHTIESVVIDLPKDIQNFLLEDKDFGSDSNDPTEENPAHVEKTSSSDCEEEWDDYVKQVEKAKNKVPSIVDFEKNLNTAIEALGGEVFPKLSWSCPKDTGWLTGSLKCKCPRDVIRLLKNSSFTFHDLFQPFLMTENYIAGMEENLDHQVILRKWTDMHPAYEFRVFVKDKHVIAVCQRRGCLYLRIYEKERERIIEDILKFLTETIAPQFTLDTYCIDLYTPTKGEVLLIDFNVFGEATDCILFLSEELEEMTKCTVPTLRMCEDTGMLPQSLKLAQPLEFTELDMADPQTIIQLVKEAMQKHDDSSSDEFSSEEYSEKDSAKKFSNAQEKDEGGNDEVNLTASPVL